MTGATVTSKALATVKWWQVIGLAIVLVVFPAYSLVSLAYLAPVLVIYALRPDVGESAATPALFFVLAVALHPLHALWLEGGDWATGRAMLTDVRSLCAVYLAGASAWVIVDLATMALRLVHLRARKAQAARLMEEARMLRAEWQIPEPEAAPAEPT
jgi:hypothetical protein